MNYDDLHDFQKEAVEWVKQNDRGFLWLKMGDGKTVIAASAMAAIGAPSVVVGTKRIIEYVWPAELKKWEHLSGLTYAAAVGSRRTRERAVSSKPKILGISYENLAWYLSTADSSERELWIFDEVSKMKSPSTLRFKALRKRGPLPRAFGLTATPTMEGHLGLWSQWRSIGGDDRLGRNISEFRSMYTTPVFKGVFTDYKVLPDQQRKIERALRPHIYTIEDYRRPYIERAVEQDVIVGWSTVAARDHYRRMEKELVAELETLSFAAASRGVAMNKCRQMAAGFVYTPEGDAALIDQEKFDAIVEAVEELQGEPVLIFYQFTYEQRMLLERIPGAQPLEGRNYEDFNAGRIPALIVHPRSCGHGLNLQGCRYAFYATLPWSGEEYVQSIRRIDRQGQTGFPVAKRFLRAGTVDEDVLATLTGKVTSQEDLLRRIRERTSE